jgi:cellobiose-specific phosphotransferase system component IIB
MNLTEINKKSTIQEIQKSQFVRIIDIALLGPFMIYAGKKLPTKIMQSTMIVAGILTITYNLNNFIKNKKNTTISS